ncbi:protein MRG1 isoform X3 [Pistacia vera]|uniref:protein MRG1 isoform X3 n=1 Tax=Pistacia vera TaxID=55513 RepID=UPI001263B701|nr:protein MRG1 isoform X3 [Pistacia vera]
MALASTKPRFKRLSCERKSGDTMFTILVGIKRIQKSYKWLGNLANSWDEWVGADRLLKHTEENLMKQQALQKKQGVDKSSKSGRSAHSKQKGSTDAKVDKDDLKSNVAKGKKRKSDSGVEKDNLSLERLIKIQIPSALKKQLVDDWEFVTQQDQLVKLPRSPNVDEILTKYIQYRTKKDGLMVDTVAEIMRGIRLYFDKALPAMLLYKKEREQYHDVVIDNVSPSTIYGAEHLLRLFVKLPELLAYVNIEDETLTRMQQKLTDFLKWLQKNQSTYFLSTYDGSSVSDDNAKGKDD